MSRSNLLYYGNNLPILRDYLESGSVDLIYLDPPFNSNGDYNVLFEDHGQRSTAQIQAFTDTWRWDDAAAESYEKTVETGGQEARALVAMRQLLGPSNMLAYLAMMAPRLQELRRVLAPTGSIFLHCDPTASHYLKLLLDAVFGFGGFRNELIWHYDYGARGKRTFGRKHDVIFWYSASPREWIFNTNDIREPFASKMTEWRYTKGGQAGKPMPTGKVPSDVWAFKVNAMSREHLGYPTQKPLALLDRILRACSTPDSVILDPFCGCGTTIAAAQALGRRWIGIDVTHLAIGLIRHRLITAYGPDITNTFKVIGEPTDIEGARQLAKDAPFEFQAWALGLVGARRADSARRGFDKGQDGRLWFHDEETVREDKLIVFSVKSGKLFAGFIRDLRGVLEREQAKIGALISLEEPTKQMRAEAAAAGFYKSPWGGTSHRRLQLLTISELLGGGHLDYPTLRGGNITLRPSVRVRPQAPDQPALEFAPDVIVHPAPSRRQPVR